MHVTYDISVLGTGHFFRINRTGIFRATEAIAKWLAASGECELVFTALESVRAFDFSKAYLQDTPSLQHVACSHPLADVPAIRTVADRIGAIDRTRRVSLPRKVLRRYLLRQLRRREMKARDRAEGFPASGIFHSPFLPLPDTVGRNGRVRRVLSVHDVIPLRFPQWFDAHVVHRMQQVCDSIRPDDWVVCHSESTRQDLSGCAGASPDRIRVAPLAAAPDLFYPVTSQERVAGVLRKYGIPDGPYVLSLNTLEPRKNVDGAIRAFAQMVRQERIRDLRFVLVGTKGWNYQRIFDALDEVKDVKEQIMFAGYVADEDLAPIYSGALAFVYPSLYEGFGLPPLEAMQCGVPVITSSSSAMPEVVGDAGILLQPDDTDGLSQSMLQLYHDPALRRVMQAKSLARASSFSWERHGRALLATYQAALA